jgi:hypothetical protein
LTPGAEERHVVRSGRRKRKSLPKLLEPAAAQGPGKSREEVRLDRVHLEQRARRHEQRVHRLLLRPDPAGNGDQKHQVAMLTRFVAIFGDFNHFLRLFERCDFCLLSPPVCRYFGQKLPS